MTCGSVATSMRHSHELRFSYGMFSFAPIADTNNALSPPSFPYCCILSKRETAL